MAKNKVSVFVIIPTIRNLNFLRSWSKELSYCNLIIVEDRNKKTINVSENHFPNLMHLCHDDIDRDFGKDSWIFSRKNAGIRSYGFWKAYKMGADVIITLDDDCYPAEKDFVKKHLRNLELSAPNNWFATYPNPKWMYTRGFPYKNRNKKEVVISHGLWSGALDLDAHIEAKLKKLPKERPYPPVTQFVPSGYFYPMCSMNLAFKRKMTSIMFFPMMGQDPNDRSWGYDRYDDIWAGIFSKKIIDHLNLSVVSGSPFIEHRKASRTRNNRVKESSGLKQNEYLWKLVDDVKLTKNSPRECYIELANKIKFPNDAYFKKLKKAMLMWSKLF